jgi:hypothetical protein
LLTETTDGLKGDRRALVVDARHCGSLAFNYGNPHQDWHPTAEAKERRLQCVVGGFSARACRHEEAIHHLGRTG